jgi:hypothetical protein
MLYGDYVVPHYPWHDPAERANSAYAELRRVSAVERQCFSSFCDSQNIQDRDDRAQPLTEAQRVWYLASREYTAALSAYVAALAPTRPVPLMQPATIICDNHRARGAPFGETALIHSVQYVYARRRDSGPLSTSHVLTEAHYVIDCPHCGRRTQIEKYE